MAVSHCVICSYLFCEPAKMFHITTKWWRNTVVIRRAGSVAGRRQGGIHIRDGSHRQRCHDIADRCQPLWSCVLISTTQQTWATVVRRVQLQCCQWRLHCRAWLSTATVCDWRPCITITTTHVTQSQWNCSLWCRRRRGRLGVITPAHITQHWWWGLAEIWSHLAQVLHCRQSTTHYHSSLSTDLASSSSLTQLPLASVMYMFNKALNISLILLLITQWQLSRHSNGMTGQGLGFGLVRFNVPLDT